PPKDVDARTMRERYQLFVAREQRVLRGRLKSRNNNVDAPTAATQGHTAMKPSLERRPTRAPARGAEPSPKNGRRPDNWRETIESIVVAFVLAFLFRTFEAEAFVIPTGSMAPTLYGQHRDITCEKCK